ncbi:MAG: type 4a pilus biogenesis protein PilO [Planctomycetes bacterium]|jgi:Tfp pilus assembly protein PilO|nr:type 4a pilus biogenesis protein PilO [Planctomycetota bacterium]
MSNWNQKKLLAIIGGSALALCLAAVGGVYYSQGLIEEIEAQVAQKKESVTAAEAKLAKVPALEKDVVILRENLDEYVKILPNSKELTAFVRMLNQFERQSGIQSTGLLPKRRNEVKGERFTPIEYTYEATATLWQCLKFMNLIENYERFVSITDFRIKSGGDDRNENTREGDVVHRVSLTLQTYSYNGKSEGKEAQIPDYAALKESLREEIWKNQIGIRIDRYDHRGAQGRRDILVDPRENGDALKGGPSPAEQRALLDRYTTEVLRLRELHQRIRKQDTTLFEQYALEKGLKEGLEKIAAEIESDAGRVSYAPYKLRWAKEIVAPLEDLRSQLDTVAKAQTRKADPFLPMKEMQQLVADMAADCNNGQLEQAKNRFEVVGSRVNVPQGDPRHELAVAAKSWHVKAVTALDFKGMDLRVQGVVVSHGGRSGVLLNGEVYEEGDYISDDLLVKTVEEEQVWFVFRGLTLVRTM